MNETTIDKNSTTELADLPPQDEYKKWIRQRRVMSLLLALLLLAEAFLGHTLFSMEVADDLHNRLLLQIEHRTNGHIQFETGVYTGETDFGYLIGEGTFEFVSGTTYTGH